MANRLLVSRGRCPHLEPEWVCMILGGRESVKRSSSPLSLRETLSLSTMFRRIVATRGSSSRLGSADTRRSISRAARRQRGWLASPSRRMLAVWGRPLARLMIASSSRTAGKSPQLSNGDADAVANQPGIDHQPDIQIEQKEKHPDSHGNRREFPSSLFLSHFHLATSPLRAHTVNRARKSWCGPRSTLLPPER
jgi:hypothetical protein